MRIRAPGVSQLIRVFAGQQLEAPTTGKTVLKRVLIELAIAAFNAILFLAAFFVGLRLVYPVVFSALQLYGRGSHQLMGLTEFQAMALSIALAFALFAAFSRLWTRQVLNVALVSGASFLLGMIMLSQAIYLADGGAPSMMWSYSQPELPEYLGAAFCGSASAGAWYVAGELQRRWRRSPEAAG